MLCNKRLEMMLKLSPVFNCLKKDVSLTFGSFDSKVQSYFGLNDGKTKVDCFGTDLLRGGPTSKGHFVSARVPLL